MPCAENLPSATAYRPGDILTTLSGKTVEVYNTDAEGRLVLADALTYAERFKPDAVIDLATLTGAITVALGKHCAGAYFSDEKLANRIMSASDKSGERLWRMPLMDEYRREMDGIYSDLKNTSGNRFGGANTAAGFLWNFAESYPWCHIDIAGTAWNGSAAYDAKGATGFGVRLLVQLLRDWT